MPSNRTPDGKKKIAVTQRTLSFYGSPHDALDRKWSEFFLEAGLLPIPLPNNAVLAEEIIWGAGIDGFLLTGGETPVEYDGTNKDRDLVDYMCIDVARNQGLPLIGVCRGMECLLVRSGVTLTLMNQAHIGPGHLVRFSDGRQFVKNSYHTYGIVGRSCEPFEVVATAEDGSVEAVAQGTLLGIMWHPERYTPFHEDDIQLFRRWYGVG